MKIVLSSIVVWRFEEVVPYSIHVSFNKWARLRSVHPWSYNDSMVQHRSRYYTCHMGLSISPLAYTWVPCQAPTKPSHPPSSPPAINTSWPPHQLSANGLARMITNHQHPLGHTREKHPIWDWELLSAHEKCVKSQKVSVSIFLQ